MDGVSRAADKPGKAGSWDSQWVRFKQFVARHLELELTEHARAAFNSIGTHVHYRKQLNPKPRSSYSDV